MNTQQQNETTTQIEYIAHIGGSCLRNPGPGGWAFVIERGAGSCKDAPRSNYSFEHHTTNNRMALTAACAALEATPVGAHVVIVSNSQYVVEGAGRRIVSWRRRDWRTADGEPVKNQDLWRRLQTAAAERIVRWRRAPGRSGDPGIKLAHTLAEAAARAGAAR